MNFIIKACLKVIDFWCISCVWLWYCMSTASNSHSFYGQTLKLLLKLYTTLLATKFCCYSSSLLLSGESLWIDEIVCNLSKMVLLVAIMIINMVILPTEQIDRIGRRVKYCLLFCHNISFDFRFFLYKFI